MTVPIILYDIPSRNVPERKAWSANTWKARFALNYKGLPVKTEWVEYPDIKALYNKLDIQTTETKDDGSPYYSLPIIHDPSTNASISDSFAIVQYLEKTYPNTPPLLPKGTLAFHSIFLAAWGKVMYPTFHLIIYPAWTILNERSQIYYRTTREKSLGMKLEDICNEQWWETAEKAWSELDQWLKTNGEGMDDLVMGDQVCFADLQIVSVLVWAKNSLGADSDEWSRICGWNGGKWKRYLDKFSEYEVVDV